MRFLSYSAIIFTLDKPHEVFLDNYPDGWIDHYLANHFRYCDPTLQHAITSSIPAAWTPDLFGGNIAAVQMYGDVRQAGMRCGLVVPVSDHRGNRASVNFSGPNDASHCFWSDERIGRLMMIACKLHQKVTDGYLAQQYQPERLTDRERQILVRIASGCPARELADEMEISVSTIEFHTRNIREKLHAPSMLNAVFKASQLNLI